MLLRYLCLLYLYGRIIMMCYCMSLLNSVFSNVKFIELSYGEIIYTSEIGRNYKSGLDLLSYWLKQRLIKNILWIKPIPVPLLVHIFLTWPNPFTYILPRVALEIQRQSWVITLWSAKPKILTLWPFIKKSLPSSGTKLTKW